MYAKGEKHLYNPTGWARSLPFSAGRLASGCPVRDAEQRCMEARRTRDAGSRLRVLETMKTWDKQLEEKSRKGGAPAAFRVVDGSPGKAGFVSCSAGSRCKGVNIQESRF